MQTATKASEEVRPLPVRIIPTTMRGVQRISHIRRTLNVRQYFVVYPERFPVRGSLLQKIFLTIYLVVISHIHTYDILLSKLNEAEICSSTYITQVGK